MPQSNTITVAGGGRRGARGYTLQKQAAIIRVVRVVRVPIHVIRAVKQLAAV